jgi:hypothetical protein
MSSASVLPIVEGRSVNAITNPTDQTIFWRDLTPQQKAFILNAK